MSKNNIVIVAIIVLIVVGVGFWVNKKTNRDNAYSVVYLTTGEVYVGKLTAFPNLELTDSYVLQVTKNETDPTKNDFQLTPVKDALWAPKSIRFIKDNVVFYGSLLPTSKIAETIATQKK